MSVKRTARASTAVTEACIAEANKQMGRKKLKGTRHSATQVGRMWRVQCLYLFATTSILLESVHMDEHLERLKLLRQRQASTRHLYKVVIKGESIQMKAATST
ncbi:hypothetical protein BVRB_005080 [Beta vulgaris subsp. vulgaris]|uniref:Uncharacterized protein n=1 Tax=Beta vulgaris subsp. vulgaris TaxID=3555 RepID=A0A0J8B459_BETVV|nr:hypothetical protein BVRB_005080 [Beta vulgaris subsp. vulgaris]